MPSKLAANGARGSCDMDRAKVEVISCIHSEDTVIATPTAMEIQSTKFQKLEKYVLSSRLMVAFTTSHSSCCKSIRIKPNQMISGR
mmetsp:Transcript_9649/g.21459  ORF Transcript_9649/g.21459 Transcript_9649/m.21459 type:complete len:86 (-) Transcript_9649:1158-1415(-)